MKFIHLVESKPELADVDDVDAQYNRLFVIPSPVVESEADEYFRNPHTRRKFPGVFKSPEHLDELVAKAPIVVLSPADLIRLENSDAEQVQANPARGPELAQEYGKDWARISAGVSQGIAPEPVVLRQGKRLYLLGGNTRIMAAIALQRPVRVRLVNLAGLTEASDPLAALHALGGRSDIPNQEWLKTKQGYADEDYDRVRARGRTTGFDANRLAGKVTADIYLMLPTAMINALPGLNDEHVPGPEQRGKGTKAKYLIPSMKTGYNWAKGKSVFVVVNHQGEAWIAEGNNRTAIAAENGFEKIPVNVRYFNGGELADGPMSPVRLAALKPERIEESLTEESQNIFESTDWHRIKVRNKTVEVIENPTETELARLISSSRVSPKIARLCKASDGTVYAWDGGEAIHRDIEQGLTFSADAYGTASITRGSLKFLGRAGVDWLSTKRLYESNLNEVVDPYNGYVTWTTTWTAPRRPVQAGIREHHAEMLDRLCNGEIRTENDAYGLGWIRGGFYETLANSHIYLEFDEQFASRRDVNRTLQYLIRIFKAETGVRPDSVYMSSGEVLLRDFSMIVSELNEDILNEVAGTLGWYHPGMDKFIQAIGVDREHADQVRQNPQQFEIDPGLVHPESTQADLINLALAQGWSRLNYYRGAAFITAATRKLAHRAAVWLDREGYLQSELNVDIGPDAAHPIFAETIYPRDKVDVFLKTGRTLEMRMELKEDAKSEEYNGVRVWKNPLHADLIAIIASSSGQLRCFFDYEHLLVWDSFKATHDQIAQVDPFYADMEHGMIMEEPTQDNEFYVETLNQSPVHYPVYRSYPSILRAKLFVGNREERNESSDLNESVTEDYLFHGVRLSRALTNLATDSIRAARTSTHTSGPTRARHGTVSLTRDPRFAMTWASGFGEGGLGVVFVLDRRRLKQDYSLGPIAEPERGRGLGYRIGDPGESEERVQGTIVPLSKYLVGIRLSPAITELMQDRVHPRAGNVSDDMRKQMVGWVQRLSKLIAKTGIRVLGESLVENYQPDSAAPDTGEFREDRWAQSHDALLLAALRRWVGSPEDARLQIADLLQNPSLDSPSGSGKRFRAEAAALLWELKNRPKTNPMPLYRGANEVIHGGVMSWTEDSRVAKHFAAQNQGKVYSAAPETLTGIRVADYLDDSRGEQEWIIIKNSLYESFAYSNGAFWLDPEDNLNEDAPSPFNVNKKLLTSDLLLDPKQHEIITKLKQFGELRGEIYEDESKTRHWVWYGARQYIHTEWEPFLIERMGWQPTGFHTVAVPTGATPRSDQQWHTAPKKSYRGFDVYFRNTYDRPNQPELIESGFITAKGSTYVLNPNGTTTRTKAARPEHPGDSGLKDTSARTVYVHPEFAREVGMWNTSSARHKRILIRGDQIMLTSNVTGKQGRDKTINSNQFVEQPALGLSPLELTHAQPDEYGGTGPQYAGNHPGNPIVRIT